MATPALYATPRIVLGTDPSGNPVALSADQAWQKLAIVGISGAGKSYAAGAVAEDLLAAGVTVAIVDAVGIFWGLRAGADGSAQGGIPIPVYGGERADALLPNPVEAAQAFVAGQSAVYDLSDLPMEELHLWAAEFFEELMAPRVKPPVPCHVILEEAPVFVPQSGSLSKHQRRCKAALAHFARVGRNRGYGMTIITQRAAAVDKNILTQCGSLLLLRIAAKIDRKSITEWVANNAASGIDLKSAWEELSELPNGLGWLWSPTWLGRLAKVCIRKRRTFHPGPNRQEAETTKLPEEFYRLDRSATVGSLGAFALVLLRLAVKIGLVVFGLWLAWKVGTFLVALLGLLILIWLLGK